MSVRRIVSREVIYTNLQERVTIYRAVDESGETLCLKEHKFQSEEERSTTAQRYTLQQGLAQDNVCRVYESYSSEQDGDLYLSVFLEWCGRDLDSITKSMLKEKVQWSSQDCFSVLYFSVSALSFAQKAGVCHRDLKPSNIFLTEGGIVKVGDFGCAKRIEEGVMKHTMAGTPLFLSPVLRKAYTQQLMGERVEDPVYNPYKSDVYSLGLTILYLLKPRMLSSLGNQRELANIISSSEMEEIFLQIFPKMLAQEEDQRMDFIELEAYLQQFTSEPTPGAEVPCEVAPEVIKPEVPEPVVAAPEVPEPAVADPEVLEVPKQRRIRVFRKKAEEAPSSGSQSAEPICKGCQRPFHYDPSELWRLELYGSTEGGRTKVYCSEKCFQSTPDLKPQREQLQRDRAPAVRFAPTEDHEEGELVELASGGQLRMQGHNIMVIDLGSVFRELMSTSSPKLVSPYLHCHRHKLSQRDEKYYRAPVLLALCNQCEQGDCSQLLLQQLELEFVKNSLYPGIVFISCFMTLGDETALAYYSVSESFVETLQRGTCHLCSARLVPNLWVAFFHGEGLEVVCSFACLQTVAESFECPVCQGFVEKETMQLLIAKSLQGPLSLLCNPQLTCPVCCSRFAEETWKCGHATCKSCIRLIPRTSLDTFGCLVCGFPLPKEDYRQYFPAD